MAVDRRLNVDAVSWTMAKPETMQLYIQELVATSFCPSCPFWYDGGSWMQHLCVQPSWVSRWSY